MKRCGNCGSTNLEKTNIKGRTFPWMQYKNLELKFDQLVLTCLKCKELYLSSKDITELDSNLKKSIPS